MKISYHARKLLAFLKEEARSWGRLTVLTHDHPDPDAMASAWALAYLAHGLSGTRARVAYGGMIGRAENRAMAERLHIPAHALREGELAKTTHVALVDTQPPFRNNRFPSRRKPDLIVDHHPRHPKTDAGLSLIDESAGATSTLMAETLLASGLPIPRRLATALIYGIGSETQNLGREAGPRDISIYQRLWPVANMRALWKISFPRRSHDFFAVLARGIINAFTFRNVIGVHLGPLRTPDRIAQIADFLLTHERITWSLVTGRYQGRLHISLRTSDAHGGAGRLLRRLLGGGNRGGGHGMIAGGSIEVDPKASEAAWQEAERKVLYSFLQSQGAKDSLVLEFPFRG